jgi:two-component system sensor histidine kinase HydH
LYIFEEPLPQPRSPHSEARPAVAGWKIRVGLQLSETDFIKRQATLQLVVSGLAVVALFALSMTLLRMLSRFLELKMREGEEKQLKSLGIMAASLAHEIRNPIGAMKGLTQLAQEDLPPDHSAQPQLKTVVSEAERLEKLVTDLLDFAHAREPQIREFQLSDVIAGITTMVQPRLEASNVALRISATFDSPIRSDPDGLKQVLLNTIMNAIEATPPGGTVELKAFDGNNDDLVVQIDDSGKGLGESSPNELFEPFTTKKARGTGLGLAVSKQIMDRLHGSLELENLPQGGARCSIRIPRLPSGADK